MILLILDCSRLSFRCLRSDSAGSSSTEADLAVVRAPAVEGGVAHPCTARVLGSGRRRKLVHLRPVADRAGGANAQQQHRCETHGGDLNKAAVGKRGGKAATNIARTLIDKIR